MEVTASVGDGGRCRSKQVLVGPDEDVDPDDEIHAWHGKVRSRRMETMARSVDPMVQSVPVLVEAECREYAGVVKK